MEEIKKFINKTYFEKKHLIFSKVVFTISLILWIMSAFAKIVEVETLSNLFADYTYFTLVLGLILLLFNK